MPYSYHWLDPEATMIQVDITGKVTWEQWREINHKIVEAIKSKPHRVDLIYNDTVGMPKGNPVPHLNATLKKLNACPNLGLIVTVSRRDVSVFVEMIIDVMQRSGNQPDHHNGGFVTSMDEALKLIKQSRSQDESRK